jgi:hypothetical protein
MSCWVSAVRDLIGPTHSQCGPVAGAAAFVDHGDDVALVLCAHNNARRVSQAGVLPRKHDSRRGYCRTDCSVAEASAHATAPWSGTSRPASELMRGTLGDGVIDPSQRRPGSRFDRRFSASLPVH